jgi:hypothetical protein
MSDGLLLWLSLAAGLVLSIAGFFLWTIATAEFEWRVDRRKEERECIENQRREQEEAGAERKEDQENDPIEVKLMKARDTTHSHLDIC